MVTNISIIVYFTTDIIIKKKIGVKGVITQGDALHSQC